jgi:CRP/FNR family transcriptional regulator, cyclic AMP receptor protein
MIPAGIMASGNRMKSQPFHEYFTAGGPRHTVMNVSKGDLIFRQGDAADSVFYIQKGRVKISVTSPHGKEATLALYNKGDFLGEECLTASHTHLGAAVAVLPCTILKIERQDMLQALEAGKSFAFFFQSFLLTRCTVLQTDLIDHLFNSSEKRLARTLLSLVQLEGGIEATIQHTTQETLAEMIGTTRSRVSFFMNRFRKMGYIQYSGHGGGVTVHRSLFNILLED